MQSFNYETTDATEQQIVKDINYFIEECNLDKADAITNLLEDVRDSELDAKQFNQESDYKYTLKELKAFLDKINHD